MNPKDDEEEGEEDYATLSLSDLVMQISNTSYFDGHTSGQVVGWRNAIACLRQVAGEAFAKDDDKMAATLRAAAKFLEERGPKVDDLRDAKDYPSSKRARQEIERRDEEAAQ